MIKKVYILDEVSSPLNEYLSNKYETILFTPDIGWNGDVRKRISSLYKLLEDYTNYEVIYIASSMGVFTILPFVNKFPGIISRVILLDPTHIQWGARYLNILNRIDLPKNKELEDFKSLFNRSNEASITGTQEMENVKNLGDLNLLVIAAGSDSYAEFLPLEVQVELMSIRHKLLSEYITLTANGSFIILDDAEHSIAVDKPQEIIEIIHSC